MKVERALISVSDKTGLVEFAEELSKLEVEIISTGGTARLLKEKGIPVKLVSDVTNFPEIMEGRVKTLHPKIFGGILAVRDNPEHAKQLEENELPKIDMVVVNLYPFEKTIAKENVDFGEAIENIDIGGPSLIRAAAKNSQDVAVVIDPAQYKEILEELKSKNTLSEKTLSKLSKEAFKRTANYDLTISNYLENIGEKELFPQSLLVNLEKVQDLRYGENKDQTGAFYRDTNPAPYTIPNMTQLHGKQLSYNNILDIDGAVSVISAFEKPTATVLKHVNPCGVASDETISEAFKRALAVDSMSAFGGIVGLNRPLDLATAEQIKPFFIEVVIAPDYEPDALKLLQEKKNIRLMKINGELEPTSEKFMLKVHGGMLVQTQDFEKVTEDKLKAVTKRKPTEEEIRDMLFAWKVVRNVKSNAIVLVKDECTTGIGAGQMSRVDASMLACYKAKENAKGSVMASDAFFPFRDGVDEASKHGITAVIQPGGSIRDQEVIDACNEHGITMVFTGVRAFKH
jgi:phosphoribosylaminoimidazolecarboxamide formyltransferase/IMP cyclohydrolase